MTNSSQKNHQIMLSIQLGWLSVEAFGRLRRYARYGKPPSPEKADPNRRFNFVKRDPNLSEQLVVALQRLRTISAQLVPDLPPPIPDDLAEILQEAKQDLKPIWARFEEWNNQVWNSLQASDPVVGQAFTCGGDLADTYWYAQGAGVDKLAEMLRSYRLIYIAERLADLSGHLPEQANSAIQYSLRHWSIGEQVKELDEERQKRVMDRLESQAKVWRDLLFGLRQPNSYLTGRDQRQIGNGAFGATGLLVALVAVGVWLAVLLLAGAGRFLLASISDVPDALTIDSSQIVEQLLNYQNGSSLLATLSSVVVVLTGIITRLSGWVINFRSSVKDRLTLNAIKKRTCRDWRKRDKQVHQQLP